MSIRTPDDEVNKPGWFLPPFKAGWTYQGATYSGHSDYAVDFNRRTPSGAWLDDRGDPVLAAAAGTVKETTPVDGYVLITHPGGYATEYRHMQPVRVKPGQKVERGDLIGNIGEAGNAPNGTHLHHRQYKDGKPIQMTFEGKPVSTSVSDSDTRPAGWTPPPPVTVVGPPIRATWESAYEQAALALTKARDALDAQKAQTTLTEDERDQARRDLMNERAALSVQAKLLADANARIAELEANPPDCSDETDRAVRAEDIIAKVRALVSL